MLLEYSMMLFVFGLTTSIDTRRSDAFAFGSSSTSLPTTTTETPPPPTLLQHQHYTHTHHFHATHHHEHELSANSIIDTYESLDPHFENTTEREIIAAVGTTARLHCRVRNLGDRAVSWIRKRDLHILTIGIMTYTNDQRFLARHIDNSDEWVLKVVSVQPRDAGIYECQVSTEPKISQAYKLMVVTSKAQILANRELYIQSGSDINLTCVAPQAPGPYTHMTWYKDSELINDSPRGGIRVISEQQMKTSNLVISRVLHPDTGNYTCAADNSNADSVFVHIIKSEQHAAMQHELAAHMQAPKMLLVFLTFFYLLKCLIK